ncbi:hypothetical protein [Dactylosporangium sp. CA-092794]|uniref:hypothetical protein n=1 Tax=Dactylosporangium sp. CA-092794 TaxID=3239929 RepID=UPI003D8BC130
MVEEPRYGPGKRAVSEYREESERLQLAPGWHWPAPPSYPDIVDGHPMKHEINMGRVDAAWFWHCTWARTYLAATDPSARDAALAEVMKLRQSAYYRWGLDALERGWRDKVLDEVSSGDTKSFRQIIGLNCPENAESAA